METTNTNELTEECKKHVCECENCGHFPLKHFEKCPHCHSESFHRYPPIKKIEPLDSQEENIIHDGVCGISCSTCVDKNK